MTKLKQRCYSVLLATAMLFGISLPAGAGPILYGVTGSSFTSSSLYTIDPTTGATTLIGATGFSHFTGLDFDPTSGILYAVQSDFV